MIKTVQISNPTIAEEIRKQMSVATENQKGLLDEKSDRFVKSEALKIEKAGACIKLYSMVGTTSIAAIISSGRVEGNICGVYVLSLSMTSQGSFSCFINKINAGISARFYYLKDGNKVSIYLLSTVDYSVTNIKPLLERGSFICHLTEDILPEGAVQINIT